MGYINLCEVRVVDIIFSDEASSIILKNSTNGKKFPIHVSIETGSLLLDLFQRQTFKRPNTFTLLSNCIVSLGAHIQTIVIDDFSEGIFIAKIILNHKGEVFSLDARPSDAIALAFVNHLSVWATAALIERLSCIEKIPPYGQKTDIFVICH
ncbi:MAG: bifunctional nuclease family protein [Puniceicoccales bacterium]|nr:bifunctional nuclease family protein [Puniceicoccales bacterium]